MNAERRKRIAAALDALAGLRATLETIAEEEREAFDNLPASLQEGDQGQASETAATILEDSVGEMEGIAESLGDIA